MVDVLFSLDVFNKVDGMYNRRSVCQREAVFCCTCSTRTGIPTNAGKFLFKMSYTFTLHIKSILFIH